MAKGHELLEEAISQVLQEKGGSRTFSGQWFPVRTVSTNEEQTSQITEILRQQELRPQLIFWALLIALFLGGAHALEPGHGKTVVAAYLVGNRGKIRHAITLGAIVTFTHTIGVILLGVIVLYAYSYFVPSQIMPWTGFASGMLIVGVGLWLLIGGPFGPVHGLAGHSHHHQYNYSHSPHHSPTHRHNHGSHSHEHGEHSHEQKYEAHSHSHSHGHPEHTYEHAPGDHSHYPTHAHSHIPETISWGSLLSLGISGGLVPCPGALVILLTAISLNRVAVGLLLLVAFSLGLAAVLIAIGILMVIARPAVERFTDTGHFTQFLPRLSAAIILLLGAGIAIHSLVSGGIITVNLGS
jgi:ABC-type nickel/cobalt efflux system permease component RcnA